MAVCGMCGFVDNGSKHRTLSYITDPYHALTWLQILLDPHLTLALTYNIVVGFRYTPTDCVAEMAGKIDEPTFKGTIATLFGIAILMAIVRTTIRIRTQRRLLPDDLVLLFACITLVTATGILDWIIPTLYLVQGPSTHPSPATLNTVCLIESPFLSN